jgi:hypothetical protein
MVHVAIPEHTCVYDIQEFNDYTHRESVSDNAHEATQMFSSGIRGSNMVWRTCDCPDTRFLYLHGA